MVAKTFHVLLVVVMAFGMCVLCFTPSLVKFSPLLSAKPSSVRCRRVYIDLGSNRGIQIRKVFEPHLYPDAPVLPIFDLYFGQTRDDVCCFGFEPNPLHKKELGELELAYTQMGWRVNFFHVAASNKKGVVQFKRDVHFGSKHGEWGARIIHNEKQLSKSSLFIESDPVINVPTIDFAEWFEENILKREIPDGPGKPVVLAKTDMESHDNYVWASMLQRGLICHVDAIYGEHADELRHSLTYLRDFGNCSTVYLANDDESYGMSKFPLPKKIIAG